MTPSHLAVVLAAASAIVVSLGIALIYPPAGLIAVGLAGIALAHLTLRGARP